MRLVQLSSEERSALRFIESAGGSIAVSAQGTEAAAVFRRLAGHGFSEETGGVWLITPLGQRTLVRTKDACDGQTVEVAARDLEGERLPEVTD